MGYLPGMWRDFAATVGGLAGALVGLLFVAVSIKSDVLARSRSVAQPELARRADPGPVHDLAIPAQGGRLTVRCLAQAKGESGMPVLYRPVRRLGAVRHLVLPPR